MALSPGTRLGPYEIAVQIGVGGMGEVYRATDTNLKRAVAIKVLPASVSGDPDRLARFQREAEVLAALNHPNIAAIYGLEKSGPSTSSGQAATIALVMELVEGPTLADRIAAGGPEGPPLRSNGRSAGSSDPAIPLDEALDIARQIAEALEAAHEHGIIHRDLKPANIKVRADGTVKVLDFGLAKAMEPTVASSVNASMSPTLSLAATQAGVILGTAAYMSPDQARGKAVDKRADIWAFGCVLFEMLTGRRPFDGDDITVTLARVVEREPDFDALPPSVPARVRQALRVCLRKDAKQRVGDIRDVRLALEGAFETSAPQATVAAPSPSRGTRLAWLAFAVAAVGMVALAAPALRHLREAPPVSPSETRVDIVTPATTDPTSFALSPDGRQIVFVAAGEGGVARLWLRALDSTTAQPLAGTEGATSPFWAPDSRAVAFVAGSQMRRFDLGGGAPRTLATVQGPRGGTWNADGVIVFTPNAASPLFRIPASGGSPVAVTTLDRQQTSHRWPVFLPDGRRFLFYAQAPTDTAGIYLGALDSKEVHRLTQADAAGVYLASAPGRDEALGEGRPGLAGAVGGGGWLLSVRGGTLVAQWLDLNRQTLTGDPLPVADAVVVDQGVNTSAVSVSAAGLVAYRTGAASRRQLTWLDRSGKVLGLIGLPDAEGLSNPSVSSDGRRVVVSRIVQGNTDLWLLDGARTSRVTFDASLDRFPIWSPDGRRIVFDSNRAGSRDLYQKAADGAGSEERLVASPQAKLASDWSADGRFLLYHSIDPQTVRDLWVRPMMGDPTPWVFLKTPFEERQGRFSPDGRFVAYESNESGRDEIYVRPFTPPSPGAASTTGGQWQISTAGGTFPRWRADGRELYYLDPAGRMIATPIAITGATLAPGAPVALFLTKVYGGGADNALGPQYDVTRDGRFLINTVLDDAAATPITLIQNWQPPTK